MPSRVEILYFDGCPHYAEVAQHLRSLLAREGIATELELRPVTDEETAQAERFLGSPTIRIDGRDIESGAEARDDFGMKCRLYRTPEGLRPTPPKSWIVEAVRSASS